MSILKVAETQVMQGAPEGWIPASENGWGYLTLLELQQAGHTDLIARTSREGEEQEYRIEIDVEIASYVEEAGATYAPAFLDWTWYFRLPINGNHVWGVVNDTLAEFRLPPEPNDVREAMKEAIEELYS
ncbi:hypothetical protein BJH93_10860 [Kocuria polaris]|nr:hypothetical protein [Kocuria polaris]